MRSLSDDRVIRRLGPGRELRRNDRDDVVAYLEAWTGLLEDELASREAGRASAA